MIFGRAYGSNAGNARGADDGDADVDDDEEEEDPRQMLIMTATLMLMMLVIIIMISIITQNDFCDSLCKSDIKIK